MDMITISAKTKDEAIIKAAIELGTTSDNLEYEVVEKGSAGFLGLGVKPAIIRAKKKESSDIIEEEKLSSQIKTEVVKIGANDDQKKQDGNSTEAVAFLENLFVAMNMKVEIIESYNESEKELSINLVGEDMGILIGKRGQTLDSLQYLVSLVVNKKKESYTRVKLDTENYRERRKETLETLAKNIAYKVKRTKRSVSLEPMNPYERRIIHAALQNDKYVVTRSDGEDPFRHVVISLKRDGGRRERPEI